MNKLALSLIAAAVVWSHTFSQSGHHGIGPWWGAEVPLPTFNPNVNQRGVLYNNMVVTSTGRVIISTTETNPLNPNQVYGHYFNYSDDGGTTWLPTPIRFTPTDLVIGGSSPKLMLDRNDTLYVVWTSVNPPAIFCSKLDATLNIIMDSVRVSGALNYNSFATHCTIDRYDRLHVMWHEGNMNLGQVVEAYHARSTDRGRTWSSVQLISQNDSRHSAYPHAQFDNGGDTLAIAWRDSVGGSSKWDVYVVTTTNGGQTWNPPVPVITGIDADWDPDILVDSNNRIHLFYHKYPNTLPHQNANVRYQYSDNIGVTWNLPAQPTNGQLSEIGKRSHLVEGSRYDAQRNVLWVTWKDERDFNYATGNEAGDMMVAYSTDRGNTWSVPEFATDAGDSSLAFKAGALFPNGDYGVNYEMMASSGGSIRVFFRKRVGVVTSHQEDNDVPRAFALLQNYPNPFNPSTRIPFSIRAVGNVTLKVYDILGREVRTLVNENLQAGSYEVTFNAEGLASGVYLYRLQGGSYSETKKLILLR